MGCQAILFISGMHTFSNKKRYFIIDQQIARHFVHYSEYHYNPPSLLCNSNNKPFCYLANHDILTIRELFTLLNIPLRIVESILL